MQLARAHRVFRLLCSCPELLLKFGGTIGFCFDLVEQELSPAQICTPDSSPQLVNWRHLLNCLRRSFWGLSLLTFFPETSGGVPLNEVTETQIGELITKRDSSSLKEIVDLAASHGGGFHLLEIVRDQLTRSNPADPRGFACEAVGLLADIVHCSESLFSPEVANYALKAFESGSPLTRLVSGVVVIFGSAPDDCYLDVPQALIGEIVRLWNCQNLRHLGPMVMEILLRVCSDGSATCRVIDFLVGTLCTVDCSTALGAMKCLQAHCQAGGVFKREHLCTFYSIASSAVPELSNAAFGVAEDILRNERGLDGLNFEDWVLCALESIKLAGPKALAATSFLLCAIEQTDAFTRAHLDYLIQCPLDQLNFRSKEKVKIILEHLKRSDEIRGVINEEINAALELFEDN